jgi:c-di-AMP phosphodiesterase-like protein
MKLDNGVLCLDEELEVSAISEFLSLAKDANEIVVHNSDIHPAFLQTLFCLSKDKKVIIKDKFYSMFFKNLNLTG